MICKMLVLLCGPLCWISLNSVISSARGDDEKAATQEGWEREDSFCKGSGATYPPPNTSLDELARLLVSIPPETHIGFQGDIMGTQRARAIMEIDHHIYQYGPLDEKLVAYYRNQIDKVLDEIEITPAPKTGVIFWKMYSSGVIFKSEDGIFGVDIVEGPVQRNNMTAEEVNTLEPRVVDGKRRILQVRLYWTPEQRARLARSLDAYFTTHRHYDHMSFTLVRDLLSAGKIVVLPEDAKKVFLDLEITGAEDIVVPEYSSDSETKVNIFHGMETLVFFGYQDGYRNITVDGYPGLEFNPKAPQNNTYIFKTGGRKIMADGDVRNYDAELLPWLISLVHSEWKPDTCIFIGYFRNAKKTIQILFDPFIIPVHELEMGHFRISVEDPDPRPLFTSCRPYRRVLYTYRNDMKRKKAAVMSWGENLYLPPITSGSEE